jgi:hypothetical protein
MHDAAHDAAQARLTWRPAFFPLSERTATPPASSSSDNDRPPLLADAFIFDVSHQP